MKKAYDILTEREAALARGEKAAVPNFSKLFLLEDVQEVAGVERTLQFTISSPVVDRDNDTIDGKGWQIANYLKNPVVLWAHDYKGLPVAKSQRVWLEDGKLKSITEFASADLYPFADTVYRMVKAGFLNATSVGFAPDDYELDEDRRGVNFKKQDLLEYSIVPVPSNPEALIEARDAGIETAPLKEWAEATLKALEPEQQTTMMGTLSVEVVTGKAVKEKIADMDGFSASEQKVVTVGAVLSDFMLQQAVAEVIAVGADNLDAKAIAEAIADHIKQGRVLSAANENKIRSAVASLSEVLSALETASEDGKTSSPQVQKESVAEKVDFIDLDSITADNDDITLSAEDVATIRAMVRDLVATELTPFTGRVV